MLKPNSERSPDGAKRNPGPPFRSSAFPHSASLHAGYELSHPLAYAIGTGMTSKAATNDKRRLLDIYRDVKQA